MRIRRIAATSFRCIETADVELGRGLNVLYGPNDHGKSTLALALRAALLLPPGSADAENFRSWFDGKPPSVQVVFEDDEQKVWRVSKTFGGGGKAELDFSKDGVTFTRDCNARQVEEQLRKILCLGIPVPGGRGGPRGFPSSFLSQVLLAEQTNVIEVLDRSLADDTDESGRIRLTKALKGLAQDPLFKRVLEHAQAECDMYYTATGQKKRGRTSLFSEAAEQTKRYSEQLAAKEKQLQDSQAAEAAARGFGERYADLLNDREELRGRVRTMREANERQQRLDAAKQLVEQARMIVERIRADRASVEAKNAEITLLREAFAAQEVETTRLAARHLEAIEVFRQAEEGHRLATSKNAARQRELAQAQLEKKRAELSSKIQEAAERRDRATLALEAEQAFKRAQQLHRNGVEQLTAVTTARTRHTQDRELKHQQLRLSEAVVAFARWRAAETAAESARQLREEALALGEKAKQLRQDAADKSAAAAMALLPNARELKTLLDLQRRLDLAEAALGGGLSLVVRPQKSLAIQTTADGIQVLRAPSADVIEIEAMRTIEASINDLLDLRIMAGDAKSRLEAERLQVEWTQEVSPVLQAAGVATLADLQEAVAARSKVLTEAEKMVEEARGLEGRVTASEERAGDLEILGKEADVREQALAGQDKGVLQQEFEKLGATDTLAERQQQARRRAYEETTDALTEVEARFATAEADMRNLAEQLERTRDARDIKLASLNGEGAPTALTNAKRAVDDLQAQLQLVETELLAVAEQRDSKVSRAEQLRSETAAGLEAARNAEVVAKNLLGDAANAIARAEGELAAMREHTNKDDLAAAQHMLQAREADVATVAASGTLATAEEVADAERELRDLDAKIDDIKQQLNQAEGALRQVGGTALRDELADLNQARERAEARERDLTIQAEAWQLLRDTLRETENTEGAHLGRALSMPVSERFVDLTAKRYGALSLGPTLATKGVLVTGATAPADSVLEALSVGTKEQLATLLRLAIAEQLHSAIVLDDHLVQTDGTRLAWFRQTLRSTAMTTQVIILTCHPEDYVPREDFPVDDGPPFHDIAAGSVRAIDLGRAIRRWAPNSL